MPIDDEQAQVMKEGTEAERLLAHPMIHGFFKQEIDDLFNAFCSLQPGASHEAYMRLHLEAFSLLNLRAKLSDFINRKAEMIERERFNNEVED